MPDRDTGRSPLTELPREEMLRALDGPWEWVHDEGDDRRKEARILTASNRLVSYVKLDDPSAALWIALRALVNEYVADGR